MAIELFKRCQRRSVIDVVLQVGGEHKRGIGVNGQSSSSAHHLATSVLAFEGLGTSRRTSRVAAWIDMGSGWSTRRSSNVLPPAFFTRRASPGVNFSSGCPRFRTRAEIVFMSAMLCLSQLVVKNQGTA